MQMGMAGMGGGPAGFDAAGCFKNESQQLRVMRHPVEGFNSAEQKLLGLRYPSLTVEVEGLDLSKFEKIVK